MKLLQVTSRNFFYLKLLKINQNNQELCIFSILNFRFEMSTKKCCRIWFLTIIKKIEKLSTALSTTNTSLMTRIVFLIHWFIEVLTLQIWNTKCWIIWLFKICTSWKSWTTRLKYTLKKSDIICVNFVKLLLQEWNAIKKLVN